MAVSSVSTITASPSGCRLERMLHRADPHTALLISSVLQSYDQTIMVVTPTQTWDSGRKPLPCPACRNKEGQLSPRQHQLHSCRCSSSQTWTIRTHTDSARSLRP